MIKSNNKKNISKKKDVQQHGAHKKEKKQQSEALPDNKESDLSSTGASENPNKAEQISNIIKMLKFHELERDIINLRTIISSIVIPKLNTIEISEVINLKIRFFF